MHNIYDFGNLNGLHSLFPTDTSLREHMDALYKLLKTAKYSTSFAEFHQALKTEQRSVDDPTRGMELIDFTEEKLTLEELCQGKETEVVQPQWTRMIENINEQLKTSNSRVKFVDTHDIATLGDKRPDICLVRSDSESKSPIPFNIVAVGELKPSDKKLSDDDAMGQVEKYLEILLQNHHGRKAAYGFLTDNKTFKVVEAMRSDDDTIIFRWIVDTAWDEGKAINALSFLSFSSLEQLYYILPEVDSSVKLIGTLGKGMSGIVYEGEIVGGQSHVVIKVYEDKTRCAKEKEIVNHLQSQGVKNIPQIVKSWDKVIAMKPIAKLFKSPLSHSGRFNQRTLSPYDVKTLVSTLWKAHKAGVVHRDVSQNNVYSVEREVLLNDWGCACFKVDDAPPYEGWLQGSSDYILNFLRESQHKFPIRFKDDLHSLARMVYCIILRPTYSQLPSKDFKAIQHFWKGRGDGWERIFQKADETDVKDKNTYDTFAEELCKVFEYVDVYLYK